ncbi:hypothetical protein NMY22_g14355 [Coprinellus aureogranulatus]|nr:hypothetical protein NMY22_g14355 [Coprinellus aureogranulatus]
MLRLYQRHTSRRTCISPPSPPKSPTDECVRHPPQSRRDRSAINLATEEELPEYAEEDSSLPGYTATYEPPTLAMYLFKFGFSTCHFADGYLATRFDPAPYIYAVFPPFWVLGAFILFSPLREPPASDGSPVWMPEKTEAERRLIIRKMREVEVKWSKRCIYALLGLAISTGLAGVVAWAVITR